VNIDIDIIELNCECSQCPSGCTCFDFRVPAEDLPQLESEPERVFYQCPRGHGITWAQVRGTSRVDDAGYPIDRNHPLWRIDMNGDIDPTE
jgi:Zn finger protein HypA/HybF involved in hydrogenase expression